MFWRLMKQRKSAVSPEPECESVSIITDGVQILGNIDAKETIVLQGRVEGNIICSTFRLTETGTLKGNIVAKRCYIAGRVEGQTKVVELCLAPSARITGDVEYEKLEMEGGAEVFGKLIPRSTATNDLKLVSGLPSEKEGKEAAAELEGVRTFGFA